MYRESIRLKMAEKKFLSLNPQDKVSEEQIGIQVMKSKGVFICREKRKSPDYKSGQEEFLSRHPPDEVSVEQIGKYKLKRKMNYSFMLMPWGWVVCSSLIHSRSRSVAYAGIFQEGC